jgi:hypothetical protein
MGQVGRRSSSLPSVIRPLGVLRDFGAVSDDRLGDPGDDPPPASSPTSLGAGSANGIARHGAGH